MIGRIMMGLAFVLASAEGQTPGRAYKVAYWYDADRPTTAVRSRVYDVDRGEYDPTAVDRWLRTILDDHPNTGAYVRDIRTVGEPGATEADRLANALDRESRRWLELHRQPTRPVPNLLIPSRPSTAPRRDPAGRTGFDRPSPGSPGHDANPSASPFPYPYRPRPI